MKPFEKMNSLNQKYLIIWYVRFQTWSTRTSSISFLPEKLQMQQKNPYSTQGTSSYFCGLLQGTEFWILKMWIMKNGLKVGRTRLFTAGSSNKHMGNNTNPSNKSWWARFQHTFFISFSRFSSSWPSDSRLLNSAISRSTFSRYWFHWARSCSILWWYWSS